MKFLCEGTRETSDEQGIYENQAVISANSYSNIPKFPYFYGKNNGGYWERPVPFQRE
jgi:hypothetical protein